jgi:Ca-activated chloride channel family protein
LAGAAARLAILFLPNGESAMKRLFVTGFALIVVLPMLAAVGFGQGVLVVVNNQDRVPLPRPIVRPRPLPQPAMSYKIKELAVNARITDQVARTQVSQSFVNTGSRQMEVAFVFPLPYDGAIDRLTFMVDGKEIPAKLLPAKEARTIYEGYVRRNQDPALLEWIGTGMFKTSVFPVPPGAERKVTLQFSQLLRKDRNLTDFLFPLGTAKYTSRPVEKVSIRATIESSIELKSVYSPTHSIEIQRPSDNNAVVTYEAKNTVPTSDFRLFYDVAKGKLGASVLSYRPEIGEDGYFLLLASPQLKDESADRPAKTVVCVFDRSGSMSGKKIEQAKEALKHVLNNLREGDMFNIVAYDSTVEAFRPELERFTEKTRKQALGFVEGMYAGGGTNIDGALTAAMTMLTDSSRPNFILFMTDGLPTMGETNEAKIVQNSGKNNRVEARLVSFGVGYDVNSRLLDRLSRENFGQSEFVRPNEDIEAHVSRLYNKISSPVMTEVAVKIEFDDVKVEHGPPINRVYPAKPRDLFAGEQLVVVGRYKKHGAAKVKITGKVTNTGQKFDFPAKFVESSADSSYAFVEKLWAMRRIGEIIDEMDLNGKNDELVQELIALSTKHGILTPYTSFLADENARPEELASAAKSVGGDLSLRRKAGELLERLSETEGRAAFAQRDMKKQLKEATRTAPSSANYAEAEPADDVAGADAPAEEPPLGVFAGPVVRDIDKDRDVAVQAVQVIGDKVLYRRANVWYLFDVAKKEDMTKLAEKAKVVTRFSEAYFDLVKRATKAETKVLAQQKEGEELVLEVGGDVYHVK